MGFDLVIPMGFRWDFRLETPKGWYLDFHLVILRVIR